MSIRPVCALAGAGTSLIHTPACLGALGHLHNCWVFWATGANARLRRGCRTPLGWSCCFPGPCGPAPPVPAWHGHTPDDGWSQWARLPRLFEHTGVFPGWRRAQLSSGVAAAFGPPLSPLLRSRSQGRLLPPTPCPMLHLVPVWPRLAPGGWDRRPRPSLLSSWTRPALEMLSSAGSGAPGGRLVCPGASHRGCPGPAAWRSSAPSGPQPQPPVLTSSDLGQADHLGCIKQSEIMCQIFGGGLSSASQAWGAVGA